LKEKLAAATAKVKAATATAVAAQKKADENKELAEKYSQVPVLQRSGKQGRPYTDQFEEHVLKCLATGTSAEIYIHGLATVQILPGNAFKPVPEAAAVAVGAVKAES